MKRILAILFICSCSAYAQTCGCDHTISSGTSDVNGNSMTISPGDTICITSGARDRIKFRNFSGTSANPVVVINCGGQVVIDPTSYSYGIKVENCNYVKFTGTGDSGTEYGFKIMGTSGYGMDIGLLTNHFELDHFEFTTTGNYAIYYNNDPTCDSTANKGVFTLDSTKVHHLNIYNCNKGVRFGNLDYDLGVYNPSCGILEPHGIENLEITDLIIENITGGDAIRLYGVEAYVARNTIDDISGRGITVGTHCDILFEQNTVKNTDNEGYRALGSGQNELHNNLFYNNGDATHHAIELAFDNSSGHELGNVITMTNNTIVNSPKYNFSVISPANGTATCEIRNNIFLNPGASYNGSYPRTPYLNITDTSDFVISYNTFSLTYSDLKFVNYGTQDFHLTHESPCINNGFDEVTETDLNGDERNLAGSVDIGAYEYVPERIAYFDKINLQGLYVNDFKYVLGDEYEEDRLLSYAQDSGFNYLLLYNLTYIHNNMYDLTELETSEVFANFIEKAKRDYGIVQIGVVGETNGSFDKIETFNDLYNSDWYKTVDVLNLEFEFWANTSGSTFSYYCSTYLTPNSLPCTNSGAFTFSSAEMLAIDERADEMGVLSEIYLGSPTNTQMSTLSEICDRVLLHYYRSSDLYTNGNSIYNYKPERIRQIGLSTRKPAVMPIFAATDEYMGTWLETHTLATSMNTWLYGQNSYDDDNSTGVQSLHISGYQWYRYTDLIEAANRSSIADGNEYYDESAEEISSVTTSQEKNSELTFRIYPNPSYDYTTVYFGKMLSGEYDVKIIDALGQQVYFRSSVSGNQLEIERDELKRGIYFLIVFDRLTGEEIYTTKLIMN